MAEDSHYNQTLYKVIPSSTLLISLLQPTSIQILMSSILTMICMINTILITTSEYPYFSPTDRRDQGKESQPAKLIKKPQISMEMLVTFDTEAEGLIQEYIWIDQG